MFRLPTKAIITAAGTGTRFLPATKVMAKEMLPLIDKPIIQHSVEELVNSGIQDIIMVTKKDRHVIADHFDSHVELEYLLERTGKKDKLEQVRKLNQLANFIYIFQKDHMPYGVATPLFISQKLIDDDEAFLYFFGDDVTLSKTPVAQQLIDLYKENRDVAAIIAVQKVAKDEVNKYGIVKIKEGTKNVLERVVEKPAVDEAPSCLAQFGRFLFTPKIFPLLNQQKHGKDNEFWLTDPIDALAQTDKVLVHEIEGKWFTTGDPLNMIKTTLEFALERDDLKSAVKKMLSELLKNENDN